MQAFYAKVPQPQIDRLRTDDWLIRRVTMPPPVPVEPVEIPWWLRFAMWSLNREGSRELDRAAASRLGHRLDDPGWPTLNAGHSFRALEWMLARCEAGEIVHLTTAGGDPVGLDLGFGPARLVDPRRVVEAAETIRTLPVRRFLSAYDPARMDREEVYPGGFQSESGRWQASLVELLGKLREFYQRAADDGDGVLVWIA